MKPRIADVKKEFACPPMVKYSISEKVTKITQLYIRMTDKKNQVSERLFKVLSFFPVLPVHNRVISD